MTTAPGAAPPPNTTALRALRHRDFGVLWTAALISNAAVWMQQIAVPFVLFELTGSKTWVGLAAFASLLPALVLTPIAGVLADRFPRRTILTITLTAQMSVAFTYWWLWLADAFSPGLIIGLNFTNGIANGIQVAAWQSFIPLLVPRNDLLAAVRLNSTQFTAARAIGPLVAAGTLDAWGPGGAFLANGSTFVLVLAAVVIARPRVLQNNVGGATRLAGQLREAVSYVLDRPPLRQATAMAFFISFFGQSLVQLAAPLASDDFHVDETGLSYLVAAVGLGSVLGSTIIVVRGDHVRRSTMGLVGLTFYGVGVLLVGITNIFWVGLLGFFVTGAAHVSVAISNNTSVQIQVRDELRGRIMSIYLLGVFSGVPLGALVGGVLGDVVGLRPVVVAYGLGLMTFLGFALARFGRLRLMDHDVDMGPASGRRGDDSTRIAPAT